MQLVADNVGTHVIPESGHWVAEEAPEQLLAALTPFLAPYRNASGCRAERRSSPIPEHERIPK